MQPQIKRCYGVTESRWRNHIPLSHHKLQIEAMCYRTREWLVSLWSQAPHARTAPPWGLMRRSEALAGVCFSCHREQASRMRSLSFPHSSPVPRIAVCTPVMLWEETLLTATWGCLSLLPWPYLSLPSITSTLTVPLLTFYNLCTFFIKCLILS